MLLAAETSACGILFETFTVNLCSYQFTYYGPDPVHKYLTLVVDDGIQPPVELSCKDRNIMAATFIRFLHKNIGWFQPDERM